MTTLPSEHYTNLQNHSGFCPGGSVKILRVPGEYEMGWGNVPIPEMRRMVGQVYEVIGVEGDNGVRVRSSKGGSMVFPWFVLERIPSEPEKGKIPLSESYKALQSVSPIKVGDLVRVLRKASDSELGWDTVWESDMDSMVGKVHEVFEINKEFGIRLGANPGYWFPWFVLEVLEVPEGSPFPPIHIGLQPVIFQREKISFGGRQVSNDDVIKLYRIMTALRSG
jgi:hypothetical protein